LLKVHHTLIEVFQGKAKNLSHRDNDHASLDLGFTPVVVASVAGRPVFG
jgi:hypothetical protein